MKRFALSDEARRRGEELVRIGQRAVQAAQEANRRLGIPNVYGINGIVQYELLDGKLSPVDPMIDYRPVDEATGRKIAANHKRRVRFRSKFAIVLHNQREPTADGENHLIALDILSDPSTFCDA